MRTISIIIREAAIEIAKECDKDRKNGNKDSYYEVKMPRWGDTSCYCLW